MRPLPTALAALMLSAIAAAQSAAQRPPAPTAEQLIAKVLDARMTTGFRIRAKLTHMTAGSDAGVTRQLLVKGRRDGTRTSVLYQVIGPKEAAGRALLLEDSGDHRPTGYRYDAGTVTPLTAAALLDPFFESDLRIEDVTEGFWYWRSPKIVGEEPVGKRRCVIVEFRPAPGTPTAYSLVKAWVSDELALPLRVEQFDRRQRLEKTMIAGRIVKRDNRWAAATLTVEPAAQRTRTVLEGSKSEQDLVLPASEFTIDAISKGFRKPS